MTFYQKILSIDPLCKNLSTELEKKKEPTTKTITLKRTIETKTEPEPKKNLRKIPFYTETIGDLYLDQGFPRLAEEVFLQLQNNNKNPRFALKLDKAREKIKEKDSPYVKKKD